MEGEMTALKMQRFLNQKLFGSELKRFIRN